MRAHTTRANFARRRQRLVQQYAAQKQLLGADADTPFNIDDGGEQQGHEMRSVRVLPYRKQRLPRELKSQDQLYVDQCESCLSPTYSLPRLTRSPRPSIAAHG
jgi:hypothetical protein